jgi:hypothetical protein
MYTITEKKRIRQEFWEEFKIYSNKRRLKLGNPGKWIMNDTNIKQLKLKFHCDEKVAFAGIEIDTRNLNKRIELFDKLEKLKKVLEEAIDTNLEWILEVPVSKNRTVSRIISTQQNVNIYNKKCWSEVHKYLFDIMYPLERVFLEYKDYLKY